MGLYCSECSNGIQNPFYALQLVIRGDKKLAVSEDKYQICLFHIEEIKSNVTDTPGLKPLAYAIQRVIGNKGGPSNHMVMDMAHLEEHYSFISQETALRRLSNVVPKLLKDPRFVELGTGQPAGWAQKVYEFLLAEQSKNPESAL